MISEGMVVVLSKGEGMSQTQLLICQIKRVIHEVRDMNKYIGNNKKQQSNNLSKPGDLPHKHRPSPHNDERSEEGCKYFVSSKCEPWSLSGPLFP